MKPTETDAIRTLGQLLLHHGTTGSFARDKNLAPVLIQDPQADSFCFTGAVAFVDRNFLKVHNLKDKARWICGIGGFVVTAWDRASPEQRQAWAQKLADYT